MRVRDQRGRLRPKIAPNERGHPQSLLPSRIDVVPINMQDVRFSNSLEDFCQQLSLAVFAVIGGQPPGEVRNLVAFAKYLDQLNQTMTAKDRRLLIALDEYEYLDSKIGEGVIPVDLLAALRTSIQSHRYITWLFSGSHEIRDLKHAEWPSYLISVRTIEIDRFTLEETTRLLTKPLEHSQLWSPSDPRRPRFAPEFWGENGIARIQEASQGWPHLVVFLAETCVNMVNQRNTGSVTNELWEDILRKAVQQSDNVMIQLLQNESQLPGEWDYLQGFKTAKALPCPSAEILRSLQKRALVVVEGNQVRLDVPMMQRWMEDRA